MFKFAIILGCALLATSTTAGVVDLFDGAEAARRIDAAIEEIRVMASNVSNAVRQIGIYGENSSHRYIHSLKVSMNETLESLQTQVAVWEKNKGEDFKKNDCGSYLAEVLEGASNVRVAMDSCILVSIIPSAFQLSNAFAIVADTNERLDRVKAWVATCKNGQCQGPDGKVTVEHPDEFKNLLGSYVQKQVTATSTMMRNVQDNYQRSVKDTNVIFDCMDDITDYRQFVSATSRVLLETVACVASSSE